MKHNIIIIVIIIIIIIMIVISISSSSSSSSSSSIIITIIIIITITPMHVNKVGGGEVPRVRVFTLDTLHSGVQSDGGAVDGGSTI